MYAGIDLSAKDENPTGICILGDETELFTVFSDQEIIESVRDTRIITFDAPLTRTDRSFRKAERELRERLGPILPLNTPSMEKLSERALDIKKELRRESTIIETYPRAVEKSLDIDQKDVGLDFDNEHEYDAYLSALTARAFDIGDAIRFGQDSEFIYIPSTETSR